MNICEFHFIFTLESLPQNIINFALNFLLIELNLKPGQNIHDLFTLLLILYEKTRLT